ncbi:hypothetical protein Tco_1238786 [Tanacetum coccineum]
MYEKVKKANENFIPIGSAKDEKFIKKKNEKAAGMDKEEVSEEPESTKVKAKIEEPKENIRKRSRRRLKMKAPKRSKRQKTDSDHEEENQIRTFLKIVPKEEEKIDYEVLGTSLMEVQGWIKNFPEIFNFLIDGSMGLSKEMINSEESRIVEASELEYSMKAIDEFGGQDRSDNELE